MQLLTGTSPGICRCYRFISRKLGGGGGGRVCYVGFSAPVTLSDELLLL